MRFRSDIHPPDHKDGAGPPEERGIAPKVTGGLLIGAGTLVMVL